MNEDIMNDMREKAAFFSIVCYGIHSKLNNWVKKEFEKCIGQKPVAFYEYFLASPITKNKQSKNGLQAYAPFLFRILNDREWIPDMREMMPDEKKPAPTWKNIKMVNNSFGAIKKFWAPGNKGIPLANVKNMPILNEIIKSWKKKIKNPKYSLDDATGVVIGDIVYRQKTLQKFLDEALNVTKENFQYMLPFIQEYSLVVLPWLQCPSIRNYNVHVCSISSKDLFFGEVLLFYPKEKRLPIETEKLNEFKRRIRQVVQELYLPVLTLFENHWVELLLDKRLDEEIKKEDKPKACECIFLSDDLADSEQPLERLLNNIWKSRKKGLFGKIKLGQKKRELPELICRLDKDEGKNKELLSSEPVKRVKKSLQFGKYIIASPGLLSEFKRISFVHISPDSGRERKYLASFLVIGGQGSGKDRMAGIIQLLYPEYRFGKQYNINMAALKPGFLSVPLMSGSELVTDHRLNSGHGEEKYSCEMLLKGMFRKVWENFLGKAAEDKDDDKAKAKEKVKAAREEHRLPVVILDELNSLDIDAQGSLLRVLQNMKVQSLGSIVEYPPDDPKMDFLVVGVVNEPEETLTLENTLHGLSEHRELIGSLATSMLYEKLRNMRRLREDLYHRLIRDGKIDLKTLAERREDIPILFSFFVKSELPEKVKWIDLWIDIDVFETLMDTRIAWEGNFRQLQSIAKKVVMQAESDNRDNLDKIIKGKNGAQSAFYRIKTDTVEKILEEDYGIMPKHHVPSIIRSYDS